MLKFNKYKIKLIYYYLNKSSSDIVFNKKVFLERQNYRPQRNCAENEVECTNSYDRKICVKEEVKDVACARYSNLLCYDDEFHIHTYETDSIVNR